MRRREFIALLGSAATAPSALWPLAARAQQAGKVVRIGFLGPGLNAPAILAYYQAFLAQLRANGFSEGQNLIVEHRDVGDPRGLSAVAAELVRSQIDLIVVSGTEAMLQAVLAPNRGIPIVLIAVNFDPILRGYVASLARPGGNITGVVFQQLELAQKQVELIKEAFPERSRLAVLWDAQTADQFGAAERTAKSLQMQMQSFKLENPPYDIDAAFRKVVAGAGQMVLVLSSPLFIEHRSRIAELAIEHRLPSMFINKIWVEAGGLMSYGADFPLMHRRVADQVAKILKGAKPADLPVEQAAKFDMIVNLKTAKAIGVELPTSILLRANEVIE